MVSLTIWRAFSVAHGGRLVAGSYAYLLDEKLIRVRTRRGEKATQLGGSPVEDVARLLLIELAQEGKA